MIGFAALPLRGVLYALVHHPVALGATQMLDGVGAGIFGALFPIITAGVTEDSRRYNLAQGVFGAGVGNGRGIEQWSCRILRGLGWL